MATLSNPVYYRNGVDSGDSRLVGFESGVNRVVRYNLTIGENESADHISVFMNSNAYLGWGNYDAPYQKINANATLYFVIGTDPNEFKNAGYGNVPEATGKVEMVRASGYGVEENLKYNVRMEGDALLIPGSTYYLWIYPGYSNATGGNSTWGYFTWYDNGAGRFSYTVTLSGSAGLIYVGNEAYLAYIDNGASWDLYIPYIDNGASWDLIS